MSKNIVFCADGTWNGPSQPDSDDKTAHPTNVFKLFVNLAGEDTPETALLEKEQERKLAGADGSLQQVAKYLHGVGDGDNFLVKALGGGLGAGLITRIVRGYTFISRNYRPGDKIYILGFSRGAYTARALAGLISAKGLLDAGKLPLDDKDPTYRLGAAVWFSYRQSAMRADPNRLQHLGDLLLDLPVFFTKPPAADQLIAAPIDTVAVWDTVGALGVPLFNKDMMRADVFQFVDQKLSANVKHGLHAIAIDEEREDFVPTLWDSDPRIVQVLFPGAHSDVGGGYALADQSGLSDGALKWMMSELAKLGVLFSPAPKYVPKPDAKGSAHQPWAEGIFRGLPHKARAFPAGLCLSQTVLDRYAAGNVVGNPGLAAAAYAPTNLAAYVANKLAAAGITVV